MKNLRINFSSSGLADYPARLIYGKPHTNQD
jgi:hypothetical protein